MPKATNPVETDKRWQAVVDRDDSHDGQFVFAVKTTGIYCRPSCPARRPLRSNVEFFSSIELAEAAGFRACLRCAPRESRAPKAELVKQVCDFIEAHVDDPVTLAMLSDWTGVSAFHLQRTFKAVAGISPKQYLDACRLRHFKDQVRHTESVSTAMVEAGYGSSSRLYESSDETLGMTPATFAKAGQGMRVRFITSRCELGYLLVASTARGICAIQIGDDEAALIQWLWTTYANAEIVEGGAELETLVREVIQVIGSSAPSRQLSLDIQATAFQQRVWNHLMTIPRGQTETYAEVAVAIGEPSAVRAVANACGQNRVAVVVPCHRVVRSDGSLGGYRWGIERKKRLLELEASND